MIKKLLTCFVFSILVGFNTFGQCNLNLPDTVCPLQNIVISDSTLHDLTVNLSKNMYSGLPEIIGNVPGTSGIWQFKALKENNRYFIFGQMTSSAYINRIEFSSDFSTLISNTYINLFPSVPAYLNLGYDMIKNKSGKWIGMQPAQNDTKLVRYEFDSIDDNTPVVTEYLMPDFVGASICKIIGNYVFVSNSNANSIIKIEFDDDFVNILSMAVLTGPFSTPYGFNVVYDCITNQYSAFSANYGTGTIVRMDFGNSLSNNNPINTVVVSGIGLLLGLEVTRYSDKWLLFTGNGTNMFQYQLDSINAIPQLKLDSINTAFSSYYHIQSFTDSSVARLLFGRAILQMEYKDTTLLNTDSLWFEGKKSVTLNFDSLASGYQFLNLTAIDSNNIEHLIYDSIYVDIPPPNVNFYINETCQGLPINFFDASTICYGSIVGWLWDFGDSNTSALQNPVHQYAGSGSYTVTLTVYAANGDSNLISKVINVVPPPNVNFIMSSNQVCAFTDIFFTDQSTATNDSIVSWLWSFGDGNSSTSQNPVYSYQYAGIYQLQLTVVNSNGCFDTLSQTIIIDEAPYANFSVSGTCVNGYAQFLNLTDSLGAAVVDYSWFFGDGTLSVMPDPLHQYPGNDSIYFVQLVAKGSNGCATTKADSIVISNPAAVYFSTSKDTVCINEPVTFINLTTSTNQPVILSEWIFSDGFTVQNVDTITHEFTQSGIYTVTLLVKTPTNCDTTYTVSVTVIENPVANFVFSNVCYLDSNLLVSTSVPATGDNIANYHWNFGDNTTLVNTPSVYHQYLNHGVYNAMLTVISNKGCVDSVIKSINVYELPIANFIPAQVLCSDSANQFTDFTFVNSNDTVVKWWWNFGDSKTATLQNPSNVYDVNGNYQVQLIVETIKGCRDTTLKSINVKLTPSPFFSFDSTCFGNFTMFNFIDSSPSTGLINAWKWNFGELGTGNSTLENPSHKYAQPGAYMVTVTATDTNQCFSSFAQNIAIHSNPVVGFTTSNPCETYATFFTDTSTVINDTITKWNWVVDGATVSTSTTANYTFNASGNYLVQLTTTSNVGCSATAINTVTIYENPKASFSVSPAYATPGQVVNFTNTSQNAFSYLWNFDDGFSSLVTSPDHVFNDTNVYNVMLIATSDKGCSDTALADYHVLVPVLEIAVVDVGFLIKNNYLIFSAQVVNLGNVDINTYDLIARFDGAPELVESITQPITVKNPSVFYTFKSKIRVDENFNPNYFCIEANHPNGELDNPANNTKCKAVENTLQLLNIAPNPAIDILQLYVNVPYTQNLNLFVYDMLGRQVYTATVNLKKGFDFINLDVSNWNNGLYSLMIYNGSTTLQQTFEKQ